MELDTLLKERHSTRVYKGDGVPDELVEEILEAGRLAPTAANNQPQKVFVIKSKEAMEKLGTACKTFGAPAALLICVDREKSWKRPVDGVSFCDIDGSIVTTFMMLKASELGISNVWIGNFSPDFIAETFSLPKTLYPVAVLLLGYPGEKEVIPEKNRKPLEIHTL